MKKAGLVTVLIIAAMIFTAARIQSWWHQETAKGHHMSFSPVTAWGFYSYDGQTLAACPPGQAACNRADEVHQYGPINDSYEYWVPMPK